MEGPVRTDGIPVVARTAHPIGTASQPQIEKFNAAELTNLRNTLLRSGLDSWQAAEIAGDFLAGHGYGASADQLRALIANMEVSRCSIDCLQAALEGVAYIQ